VSYGANKYKQTSITTANRGQILIMLYEAAIRNIKKAKLHIEEKNIEGKSKALGKVHDIINELISSLDFKIGGKIAEDLERLYGFMIEQIMKANMENKTEYLIPIEKILEDLLFAWREAVKEFNLKNPQK